MQDCKVTLDTAGWLALLLYKERLLGNFHFNLAWIGCSHCLSYMTGLGFLYSIFFSIRLGFLMIYTYRGMSPFHLDVWDVVVPLVLIWNSIFIYSQTKTENPHSRNALDVFEISKENSKIEIRYKQVNETVYKQILKPAQICFKFI